MGLLDHNTLLKWQEPREATRWRDANEGDRPLRRALAALGAAALLMLLWMTSRDPNRPSPGPAVLIALGGGVFLAYGAPALVRLARPGVWVRDYGIQIARANAGRIYRYKDFARAGVGRPAGAPDVPFLTVELHDGRGFRVGIAPELDPAALAAVLRKAGVEVAGETPRAGAAS